MKNLILIIGVSLFIASCGKELTDLNIDTKHPSSVPASTLFTTAQKNLADNMASTSVNDNIWRLIVQHWQETTYVGESNYDFSNRGISGNFWTNQYRDVLKQLSDAKLFITTQTSDTTERMMQSAMIDVLECYTYMTLVNTFGNIPYTQALSTSTTTPSYDDASVIYKDLIKRLKQDHLVFKSNYDAGTFKTADKLFAGDATKWLSFTSSLLLKMAVQIDDYDHALATSICSSVSSTVISSSSQNAQFKYLASTPNTNPVWNDLVQSGREDFLGCQTLIGKMNDLNDPRISFYFTENYYGNYLGLDPGVGVLDSPTSSYCSMGAALLEPTLAHIFIDYVDVEFLLAEAIERGLMSGSASTHYNNAITASIVYWGATAADATTYLANTEVVYGAKPWKEQIGTQKWIALYNRGYDAWTDQRRLDFPKLKAPANALSDFPIRMPYPISEQNLNTTNWTAASASIGGDLVTTKLFWDKY